MSDEGGRFGATVRVTSGNAAQECKAFIGESSDVSVVKIVA